LTLDSPAGLAWLKLDIKLEQVVWIDRIEPGGRAAQVLADRPPYLDLLSVYDLNTRIIIQNPAMRRSVVLYLRQPTPL